MVPKIQINIFSNIKVYTIRDEFLTMILFVACLLNYKIGTYYRNINILLCNCDILYLSLFRSPSCLAISRSYPRH